MGVLSHLVLRNFGTHQIASHDFAVCYFLKPSFKPTNPSPDRVVLEEATSGPDVRYRRQAWLLAVAIATSFDRRQGRHLISQARQEEVFRPHPTASPFGPFGWRSSGIRLVKRFKKPPTRHACGANFVRAWTRLPAQNFVAQIWALDLLGLAPSRSVLTESQQGLRRRRPARPAAARGTGPSKCSCPCLLPYRRRAEEEKAAHFLGLDRIVRSCPTTFVAKDGLNETLQAQIHLSGVMTMQRRSLPHL
jgi:hypothetical protein